MKHFFISLVLILFFSTVSAQEVRLPNKVAVFFLERAEISYAQEDQLKVKDLIIVNLSETVTTTKSISETLQHDIDVLREIVRLRVEENEQLSNLLIKSRKEIRILKIQRVVIVAGTVVVVILLL